MSIELTSKDEQVERIPLFYIDGVEYSIPNKVRMNVQLKFMRLLKEDTEAATTWLLLELLGKEGYEALENYEDLTAEQFEAVFKEAAKVVLGVSDDDFSGKARNGKSSNASKK